MSLDAQDWVWEHSQAKGTARLVLLAIADKASGARCQAYAGTTMLVRRSKAARSSVVVAVDKLIELGELAIVEGRKGPGGETVYSLPLACGHRRSNTEGGPESGPVQNPDRSGNKTPRGPETGPPRSENRTPTGPDSGPHNASNASNARQTQGAQHARNAPIDDDGFKVTDSMRRWAVSTFGNAVDIEHETAQFLDHHRASGSRRSSWPAAWQKWIRQAAKWQSERAFKQQPNTNVVDLHARQTSAGMDPVTANLMAGLALLEERDNA